MLTPEELAWHDQEDSHVARIIREYGLYVLAVLGDREGPSFAYSVGLFGMGHPELVVAGLAPHTMQWIINEAGTRVRNGADLIPGETLDIGDQGFRVYVEDLPNPGEILFAANRHYRRRAGQSVDALQLIWCDEYGHFPWEDGYAAGADQPQPGDWHA